MLENEDFILIAGPMYASKSKKLIDSVEDVLKNRQIFEAFKPSIDSRDGDFISSREYPNKKIQCRRISNPNEMLDSKADVLIVDEAQFFEEHDFRKFCEEAKKQHKKIVMAMLNRIADGSKWTNYKTAKEFCNRKIKLKARCNICQKPASYTARFATSNEAVQIEGEGVRYEPRCKEHFLAGI